VPDWMTINEAYKSGNITRVKREDLDAMLEGGEE
jgi:hypothetical protein